MGSMVMRSNDVRIAYEIITIDILSCLVRIPPHIVYKVFVLVVDTSVDDGNNDISLVFIVGRIVLPDRNDIYITSADSRACATVIIIMPLLIKHRIIKDTV